MSPTYSVSTYDVADDPRRDGDWTEVASGLSLFGLRPVLRDLYGRGYCNMSIAVDRDEPSRRGGMPLFGESEAPR